MTWSEFKSAVRVHLVAHGRRQGIQSLIDSLIKAASWDLQASVPFYLADTRRTVKPTAMRTVGYAAATVLPVGTRIKGAFATHLDSPGVRVSYSFAVTTSEQIAMEEGNVANTDKVLHYSPKTGTVLVTPNPKDDGSSLVLLLESKRLDFEDDDEVPFDDQAAKIISEYVMAHLSRTVDHDLAMAQSHNASYLGGKRILRSELNEAGLTP